MLKKPAGSPKKKMIAFVDCMVTSYPYHSLRGSFNHSSSAACSSIPCAVYYVCYLKGLCWQAEHSEG